MQAARAQQYLSYVQEQMHKFQGELNTMQASKPVDDLTVQDVFDQNPHLEVEAAEKRKNYDF